MNKNKGVIGLGLILAIVLGVVAVGGGAYYLGKSESKPVSINPENVLPDNQNQEVNQINKNQSVDGRNNSEAPSIVVISPNGGERLSIGSKYNIKYKTSGAPQDAIVFLFLGLSGGDQWLKLDSNNSDSFSATEGSYEWTVPKEICGVEVCTSLVSGGNYKLKAILTGTINNQFQDITSDYSDNSFTINSSASSNNWKTYANSKYGFNIKYPKDYLFEESNYGGFYNEINIFTASINIPTSYQNGTDINVGRVSVSVSPTIAKCYSSNYTDEDMTATKLINSKEFHYNPKQPFGDSAMGGQRGTFSMFSIIENGLCYRIEKSMGYRDRRGFSEPPYPPHYDEKLLNTDLDNIINTLMIN